MPSLSEALHPFSAVVLTGGSSGIGKSFIELGGKLKPDLLFCNLSRRAPPENIFPNSAKNLKHFPCDLAHYPELRQASARVGEYLQRACPVGELLLINNAGFGSFAAFADLDLERELGMIDVNVRAVVELTGLMLPLLRDRGGAIMTIASTVAFQPTPYCATYGATKAFVLHWTLALNQELRGSGVRALAVCPGTTRTEFFDTAGANRGSMEGAFAMSSRDVVASAFRALGRRRSVVVPGWGNRAYTFLGAKLPKPLAARIAGRILSRRRPKQSGQ